MMGKLNYLVWVLFFLAIVPSPSLAKGDSFSAEVSDIRFSPDDSISDLLRSKIDSAKESVDVMVFIFEYQPLVEALEAARLRGVEVRVLTDQRSHISAVSSDGVRLNKSVPEMLHDSEIETRIFAHGENDAGIMHNKAILIDSSITLVGSYNFQFNAEERNFENMFVISSVEFNKRFRREFQRIWVASETVPVGVFLREGDEDRAKSEVLQATRSNFLGSLLTPNRIAAGSLLLFSLVFNALFVLRKIRENSRKKRELRDG